MTRRGLFVYGTLHPDRAPREIRDAVSQLRSVGEGSVAGEVLDLGEYPGLIETTGRGRVPGEVFALPDDPAVLRALDAYEGYDPDDIAGSLFRREAICVTRNDGREESHWVYLYNRMTKE